VARCGFDGESTFTGFALLVARSFDVEVFEHPVTHNNKILPMKNRHDLFVISVLILLFFLA